MTAARDLRTGGAAVYFKHPGIGDLIWHLPFLQAVADANAGKPVTVMCRPSTAAKEVLVTDPRMQVWYVDRTKSNLKELTGCLKAFRALKPDSVWVLDPSSRPAMAASLSKVPHIHAFGFGRRSQERWLSSDGARLPSAMREMHPVELYYALGKAAGLPAIDVEPRLQADPALAEEMRGQFGALPRPWVFFGVGATNNARRWPAENFGALARILEDRIGTLFWFGGPGEKAWAEAAATAARRDAPGVDVTGRFDLPRSIALLSLADLYVGNDSGPMNLAAALGVRAFGLFGSSVVNNSPRIELIVRDRFFPGMSGITPEGAAKRIAPAL